MVEMLNEFKSIVAIEVNMSCPNVCNDWNANEVIEICKVAKENSHHPIILKLSVAHSIKDIIPYVEEYIEAISINSVPWLFAFPNQKNLFARYGIKDCGVSGEIIQSHTWKFANKISQMTSIPVVWPSVWKLANIKILKERWGAQAFSLGSIFFYPWKLRKILIEIKRTLESRVLFFWKKEASDNHTLVSYIILSWSISPSWSWAYNALTLPYIMNIYSLALPKFLFQPKK